MIWIIGGTSETAELIDALERDDYVVTVTTYAGLERLSGYNVIESRMDLDEMKLFISRNAIDTVVDMSHPFAYETSENGKQASRSAGVRYIRYRRESADRSAGKWFGSLEELKSYLSGVSGTVFFTTGIKDIPEFESLKGENRFIYRVLPTTFSIERCAECGVKIENIIAGLGPYTVEFNEAMFQNYGVDFVVMKDSGDRGGTAEKIEACRALNIEPLILGRRDAENGTDKISEILEMID